MRKSTRTIINMASSVAVLSLNVIIGFWLSPYIIKHVGVEANGFVSMAGNFITYASLIVTALNSMAARYITIAYVQKDYKKANLYYNSVFWGNLIIVAVLFIPAVCLIVFFENIFDVPPSLLVDVKILFAIVFASFFIGTGAPNYDVGCFVSNRLDRQYLPEMITQFIRAIFIFGTFSVLAPHIWYVSFASLLVNLILLSVNRHNTHYLTPELKISLKRGTRICSWRAIKELVGSGLWSSISNMGNILLSGLDLLVCNTLLGATAMGVLSVSKILGTYLQQFSSSLTRAFTPELTIDYANGNDENLKLNLNRSMKITACLLTIATAGMLTFGEKFFSLWVPSQNAKLLAVLSGLSFLGYIFTSGTQILYNVFSVTNHVKESSIAQIISGIASIGITVTLVKYTDLGMYAVAGVSTLCNFVRNMTFTLPMTAKWLGFKKTAFYPIVIRTFLSTLIICVVSLGVQRVNYINSWSGFLLDVIIVAMIGLGINLMIMLSKQDREFVLGKIKKKLRK